MDTKAVIKRFILHDKIDSKSVDKLFGKLNEHKNITINKIIKISFDILNDYIYKLSNGEDEYIDECITKCVNMIYVLCNNRTFTEKEIIVNKERIKKAKLSIMSYANKYNNQSLIDNVERLESIILDKQMYTEGFVKFIKILINKNENPNIIKKFINEYKNVISIEKTDLFDFVFKKTISSINNNNENIYYYLTLLRILDNPDIEHDKYKSYLIGLEDNPFAKEIVSLLNGNKFSLTPSEILDKYNLIKKIPESGIILEPKAKGINEKIFTIDGDNTKLRDDGLSIKKDGNKYIVGIHIADAGKHIDPFSDVDLNAKNNFKCIYRYGNTRILPHEYENALSLDKGKSRDTISLYVVMNDSGEILDYYIKKNTIIVSRNLSYLQNEEIMNSSDKSELKRQLEELFMLSKALEYNDIKKSRYWDKKEKSKSVNYKNISFKGDMIIREFMVLYNTLFGKYCNENNIPYIYRYQDGEYISELLDECGIGNYQYIKDIVSELYLDSRYSTSPLYHSGMGIYTYTQSCDPLRKYPDLYEQYLAHKFIFKDKDFDFDFEQFERLVEYFNLRSMELLLMRDEYKRALKYNRN
ncbi:MAG: RNB domain-containing ribonuclease [Bacilli bacterium]